MEYKLLDGEEINQNIFTLRLRNVEGNEKFTPSRAFKRTNSDPDRAYFTEVFISLRNDEMKDGANYDRFDTTIEAKLKKKEVTDNINIISFYGDNQTEIEKLSKFEDLGLLTNFEGLFNDHLIALPYSLKLQNSEFNNIFSNIRSAFDHFVSTLSTENIFGYLPVYARYSEFKSYFDFYSGKKLGKVRRSDETYNAIPLLIDFKRANPDGYKRSVAYLLQMKKEYMKEGYYPIYYAANVSRPRIGKNTSIAIAKEFLLSFVGFDIIGASQAVPPHKGGGGEGKKIRFDLERFNYSYTGERESGYKGDKTKSAIFENQTKYLHEIHEKTLINPKYVIEELVRRPDAKNYIETLDSRK
jgi:hypothetical protein